MNIKNFIRNDFPASVVVFLVALPLCLGVALASGAPLFAGLLAGVVGGIVVGVMSGSSVSVSGPAAGLTTIVMASIATLGSFEAFLLSLVIAGLLQIILGFLGAGNLGSFFPASVVKGMLAAIGLILILKQIPHAIGYDLDFEGDENFFQIDGQNTFSEIFMALNYLSPGAMLIGIFSLTILILWETPVLKRIKYLAFLPPSLVVVLLAILANILLNHYLPSLAISSKQMVSVPAVGDASSLGALFLHPDFSLWMKPEIYGVAITLALVASIETLLSIEATEKLDPRRGITPLNRELKAQGVANALCGMLGGLPVTSVVVRSSANIYAGARTKASTITHGSILLISILTMPSLLSLIPLSSLAAILIVTGYKLVKPELILDQYNKGTSQFLPFIVTVLAILFTNLLLGIFCGILVAVFFILKTNFQQSIILVARDRNYLLKFTKDVSFLHKSTLRTFLLSVPPGSTMVIDGSGSQFIDQDIREAIEDFKRSSDSNNIQVELKNISLSR